MAGSAPRKRAPAKKAAAPPPSRRERLMARSRPSVPHRLLVDPDGARKAQAELDEVTARSRQAMLRSGEGSSAYRKAEQALKDAQDKLDAYYETVTLTALPPAEYEALIEAHPPTDEQRKAGEYWNVDTFRPALLAACTDAEMTEQDWAEFLRDHLSAAEHNELWALALGVNDNSRFAESVVLPKGSTPTRGLFSSLMSAARTR